VGTDLWLLGHVAGVFGVRGELRLWLDNRDSTWLIDASREVVLRSPDGQERQVSLWARPGAGRRILGRIEGLSRPEQAEALVDWQILVPRDALPDLDDDSWYIEEIMGLEVRTEHGALLGKLVEVHQGAPVEVWEIHGDGGVCYVPVLVDRIVEVGDVIVVREDGVVLGEEQCASTS